MAANNEMAQLEEVERNLKLAEEHQTDAKIKH